MLVKLIMGIVMKMQFVPWLMEVQLANATLDMTVKGMYVPSHMVNSFQMIKCKYSNK
jgi:hypothetical protein